MWFVSFVFILIRLIGSLNSFAKYLESQFLVAFFVFWGVVAVGLEISLATAAVSADFIYRFRLKNDRRIFCIAFSQCLSTFFFSFFLSFFKYFFSPRHNYRRRTSGPAGTRLTVLLTRTDGRPFASSTPPVDASTRISGQLRAIFNRTRVTRAPNDALRFNPLLSGKARVRSRSVALYAAVPRRLGSTFHDVCDRRGYVPEDQRPTVRMGFDFCLFLRMKRNLPPQCRARRTGTVPDLGAWVDPERACPGL